MDVDVGDDDRHLLDNQQAQARTRACAGICVASVAERPGPST
jgi:hypothetical protein